LTRVEIGQRLKELRLQKGMNCSQVGRIIGTSEVAILHYEAGRRMPNEMNKAKYALLFGVEVLDLFAQDEGVLKGD
jgi:transcriptional regulator with XRE-family HTH domain